MAGTVMPIWRPQFLDANGAPLSSGTVETYESGSSTPLATYSNEGLTVSNGTTITLNAGGFPTVAGVEVGIFLLPRAYRFVLKNSAGTTQRTIDGVYAVQAASSVNLEVDGTAGEALTAGDWAYQSDGSNSLTAGRWYKTDADLYYASIHPNIAYVPSAIASGGTGTLRIGGVADSLSGLSAGTTYYLSATAGAITATAPANARPVGVARSATAIDMSIGPAWLATDDTLSTCDGRLTLTSGTPVTTADVTGATSIYFTPYKGNRVALFDGSKWKLYAFSELTFALGTLSSGLPYDLFLYDNAGTLTLEATAWTNATTRATALTTQNGVYVKTGAATRRYLGTFYTTSTTQTEDSETKRFLFNYYNRAHRPLRRVETTGTWTYTTATIRQANGAAANQVEVVIGVAEHPVDIAVLAHVRNTTAGTQVFAAVGYDSTTAKIAGSLNAFIFTAVVNNYQTLWARVLHQPAVGWHRYVWLEYSQAAGTTTWAGTIDSSLQQSGMVGGTEA